MPVLSVRYKKLGKETSSRTNHSRCHLCTNIYEWTHSKSNYNTPVQRTAEEITNQKKYDFAALAKQEVEFRLKAPSTAKFNTSPTITEENGTYSIKSWVDSENSYGAMIRSTWSAKAHYIGGDSLEETGLGANWIIDEFYFDGEKIK